MAHRQVTSFTTEEAYGRSTTPLGHRACSGARTSRRCRAPGGSAWRCSPRSYPGYQSVTSPSWWARPCAPGGAGASGSARRRPSRGWGPAGWDAPMTRRAS